MTDVRTVLTGKSARWLYSAAGVVCCIAFTELWSETYLYASSLAFVFTICGFLHAIVFRDCKWTDPPERVDTLDRPDWREHGAAFARAVTSGAMFVAVVWALLMQLGDDSFHSGGWYLFYIAIFAPFVAFTRKRTENVNFKATLVTVLVMDLILSSYEYLLLSRGTGWAYEGTIIGHIFDVPVENILFIYPVAGALVCVLYSIVTRYHNDFKAFWLLMGGLTCVFVPVELVGIGWLHLWDVDRFSRLSILPFWHTNIEEFVYYLLFQALAALFYIWFEQNLARPPEPA